MKSVITICGLQSDRERYVFSVLMDVVGCSWREIAESIDGVDIFYGDRPEWKCKIFVKRGAKYLPEKFYNIDGEVVNASFDLIEDSAFYLFRLGENEMGFDSIGRPIGNMHLATRPFPVNENAQILSEMLDNSNLVNMHNRLPLWPDGKRYAISMTHDIDYPHIIRWVEVIRVLMNMGKYSYKRSISERVRVIAKIINGEVSYFRFEDWIRHEENIGIKSAFYFSPVVGSLLKFLSGNPDVFYDIKSSEMVKIARFIQEKGWEVGLHASFNAYKSTAELIKQKKDIEEVIEAKISGLRHHFANLDSSAPEKTLAKHAEAGFLYDSSLCFESQIGPRCGLALPFFPYNIDEKSVIGTLQLPMTMMDSQVFEQCKNGKKQFKIINDHIESIQKIGGMAVFNWHGRTYDQTMFPQWGVMELMNTLSEIKRKGDAYIATPTELAEWWITRVSKLRQPMNACVAP